MLCQGLVVVRSQQERGAACAPSTLRLCCQVTACCLFHFLIPTNACGWVSGQGAGDTNRWGTRCSHPSSPALATPTLSPGHTEGASALSWAGSVPLGLWGDRGWQCLWEGGTALRPVMGPKSPEETGGWHCQVLSQP